MQGCTPEWHKISKGGSYKRFKRGQSGNTVIRDPALILPYLKMDYHKPSLRPLGNPNTPSPTDSGIRPLPSRTPLLIVPYLKLGCHNPLSAQRECPPTHPLPPTEPRVNPDTVTDPRTIVLDYLNPPASPGGKPTNPFHPYPTQCKSRYRPGPQQSS